MSGPPSSRHLVERAMEALGKLPAPPAGPSQTPAGAASPEGIAEAAAGGPSVPAATPPEPRARASLAERALEGVGGMAPPDAAGTVPPAPPQAPAAAVTSAPPPAPAQPSAIRLETLHLAGFLDPASSKRSRTSEEMKVVQQQVLRALQTAEPAGDRISRLVMITSARPDEGKSFCSLNLAAYLALSVTEQVVLVDADGKRRDTLSARLGQQDKPGLRLLAADPVQRPERLLVPTAIGRLSFLPFGPPVEGAAELPSGTVLAETLRRLAAALPGRILVLDTPPCLATSEPGALASVAGQVVMVVEAERTQRNEVEAALDMVESCPTLQLLLNRTRLTRSDSFGAYGYYGYYGG
ncbi:P-loop NTPase family protein [Paracraurococcus lichenis]|uniref:Uncharacterized protein n=1 Tax=Paracraurococcus lichenis TaxID=3064888 RepID=A0ABT9E6D3_9PROT|nr:hypothetical protein [Paracraurococcus sp. LOR1-02]MDO9711742.1 hypothetical protein [Paracraurococcus sp. LOR1-02]